MPDLFAPPVQSPVALFLLVLLIIFAAPPLMARLRLPGITGYILAGLMAGPYGLHWLERNAAIDLLATVGLLYIMFLAGLQLDLRDFRQTRDRSLIFGGLTFFIPILLGFPLCLSFLHCSPQVCSLRIPWWLTRSSAATAWRVTRRWAWRSAERS